MSKKVQIYALLCPLVGDVRYIGKANNAKQRFRGHLKEVRRRTPLYDWIGSLKKKGLQPSMNVLLECENELWEHEEVRLISEYRASGARLLNLADGGNAPKCSDDVRSRNGLLLSKRLSDVNGDLYGYWVASKKIGNAITNARKRGSPVDHLLHAQGVMKKLDEQGRIRFSKKYLELHPPAVKQTWENRNA